MNDFDRAASVPQIDVELTLEPNPWAVSLRRGLVLVAAAIALLTGAVVLTFWLATADHRSMLKHGPPAVVLDGWIEEGEGVYRQVEHFRAEHGRLPDGLRELARFNAWDEPARRGVWWTKGWQLARLEPREFDVFLKISLSWSAYDVLVRRSIGLLPEDLEQQAVEVIERGPWRYVRGAEDVSDLPALDRRALDRRRVSRPRFE